MDKTIYLCLAHMSEEGIEQKYVKEAFDTNWVVPLGPNVNAFEEDLKRFVGEGKEVVALSAGTAAVHLAGTVGRSHQGPHCQDWQKAKSYCSCGIVRHAL